MIRKHFGALALAIATALGLGAAGVLYAQTQDHGDMMGMMQDCPMMQARAEGPAAALEHRDELDLSNEQVEKLEALQEQVAASRGTAMERMKDIHEEIRAATEGERFDEAAARAAFERMGALHTEMGMAMLRARHETHAVLTPEQREKLDELTRSGMGMHGMMGGMQGMMEHMKDCPMMQGGMGGMQMSPSEGMPMQHHPHN